MGYVLLVIQSLFPKWLCVYLSALRGVALTVTVGVNASDLSFHMQLV